jgi:hypothetical protein
MQEHLVTFLILLHLGADFGFLVHFALADLGVHDLRGFPLIVNERGFATSLSA